MTTFLKGDTTAEITLALAEGFDYSGKTVCLEYQGVKRSFSGATAGGTLAFFFNAEETAPMSLGTYPVRAWIEDDNGNVTTINNADVKMRVTDCIADVRSGSAIYLDVRGGLSGIDGLPERYTDEDVRNKINEILLRLGGTVAMLLLCALPVFGASLSLHTAPKGVIYNDQQVVTNATLDVSDLVTTGQLATAVGAIPAPDYSTSNAVLVATIEAASPGTVSNIVTKAYVEGLGISSEETDPVWNAEKSDYATKADLSTGQITVNSAEYAESAHDAYNADYATLAEGLRDGPTEIYANTIFSRLDAAATTNAQQTAALDHKLDLAGGTMTGNLVMGYNSLFQVNGGGNAKFQFSWGSALDNLIISAYRETSGSYSIRFPTSEGLLALTSDIPTTMAWSAITGKPTIPSTAADIEALPISGGTMTGALIMNAPIVIRGNGLRGAQFGDTVLYLLDDNGLPSRVLPYSEIALTSDIPTTMAWSAITGKPTTISGYGITDALSADDLSSAISATNTAFSNAVLSVGLNIDTNTVAQINALVEQGEEMPVGSAATVGGLLLALAAAVAALKRDKANKVANATAGNLATLTAQGNLADAGYHFEVRGGIPCIVQYT